MSSTVDTKLSPKPSVIFFGTPEFALPALRVATTSAEVKLVISQPDRPSGRGQQLTPPPVKVEALKLGIPVLQPESLRGLKLAAGELTSEDPRSASLATTLNSIGPIDAAIVIAYGKLIPKALLAYPRSGCVNIHGSILPRWRGAAPVHRAIFAGDTTTGVCLMQLEEGLDTGPVFSSATTEITPADNFLSLHDRLSELGAGLLERDLLQLISGALLAKSQPELGVTYAEKWTKEDCHIVWNEPADVSERRIRASAPFPGGWSTLDGELVKIHRAEIGGSSTAAPGTVLDVGNDSIRVACGNSSSILLTEIQFPGKKRLPVAANPKKPKHNGRTTLHMKRLIAPSILAADLSRLSDEVGQVLDSGADWIHVDVMDGHFVPPITFGAGTVAALRKHAPQAFLDVHLMIEQPENQIEAFAKAGANLITVHVEACPHLHRIIQMIKERGAKAGVALNPATSLTEIQPILSEIDLLLVMTVNPGWGGQQYIPLSTERIKQASEMLSQAKSGAWLEVDGGITDKTVAVAGAAGANVMVAGSYVFGSKDYRAAISSLRQ